MEEQWQEVSYTTYYGKTLSVLVSESGKVKYPQRSWINKGGTLTVRKEKKARYNKTENGYVRAGTNLVHRLVAEAFVEKPKEWNKRWTVNHKDLNKENNHWSNLEWVTMSENQKHYNNSDNAIGRKVHPLEVKDIEGNLIGIYRSKIAAARDLNLSKQNITMMIKNGYKQCKGYVFREITKEEYEKKRIPNGRVTEDKRREQTKVR